MHIATAIDFPSNSNASYQKSTNFAYKKKRAINVEQESRKKSDKIQRTRHKRDKRYTCIIPKTYYEDCFIVSTSTTLLIFLLSLFV